MIKGSHVEIKLDVSDIDCEVCSGSFLDVDGVIDHLIEKHDLEYDKNIDIPFQMYRLDDGKCIFCEEQFAYFGNLVKHVNVRHPQNCFTCNDCGTTYNKKRDLAYHFRTNHRRGGYPCTQCSVKFENKRLLETHKRKNHSRKCDSCDLRFVSFSLLKKHVRIEHSDYNLDDVSKICNYCSRKCHSKVGLKQHLDKCTVKMLGPENVPMDDADSNVIQHKINKDLPAIRENIVCVLNMSTALPFKFFGNFKCFYCSKKFVDFEELRNHTMTEHAVCDLKCKSIKKCKADRTSVKIDISVLKCKVCSDTMDNLDQLIGHLIDQHGAKYDKTVTGCFEPYKILKDKMPCPLCLEVFRYFNTLLRHINSVHNENKNICSYCGRGFKNLPNLNVHISHAHSGSVECDICLEKFKNQWCLSRHKATIHDVKEHKCSKCPEMFQSQYQMQKHLIKIHNEGHKCSYCSRLFTRNSFMKDHIRRTHLKEKNVPCSVCNERFFDNYLLRMHMVKHDGERKFNCALCGKAFLRRSNLYSHMEMHKKNGHVLV